MILIGSLLWLSVRPAVHTTAGSAVRVAGPMVHADGPAPLRMLALGDSYTIGESVAAVDRYPVQLVRRLRDSDHIFFDSPEIIATTGWTTGNLLDAIPMSKPEGPYAVVTLLIGVNNQYQGRSLSEYSEQLTTLLRQSIALAGNRASHVLVLSIPDYSVTPFGKALADPARIAAQIDSFNIVGRQVTAVHGAAWLDITTQSRKAADDLSLVAVDGLHFSGKEYQNWARLMEPVIRGMGE
ncbi:SGNH/GDSL hydrolase family protein [Puia sp. P3]|uniref:SGNH/GDSL hydrolase family protein n=1 Tax=Puia sp. P3 TaxID=3423952 RepID=UPI003D66BD42